MSLKILPRHFVEKPWGQSGLPAHFGGREERIGEIWFDCPDAPLPLLCKWLFTSEKLSVQVHPNDEQARARGFASGKEECWIVAEAEEGAKLGIGVNRELSHDQLREASLSGAIEGLLDWKPIKPGDWFYIPAGTVHAIGAGVQLVEIQQNADVTFRLYDYGRPRELHLDDGVAVSNTLPYDGMHGALPTEHGLHEFFKNSHFSILIANGDADLTTLGDREYYFVPITGMFESEAGRLVPGMVACGTPDSFAGAGSQSRVLIAVPSQSFRA